MFAVPDNERDTDAVRGKQSRVRQVASGVTQSRASVDESVYISVLKRASLLVLRLKAAKEIQMADRSHPTSKAG
jgi:hypothetical protein